MHVLAKALWERCGDLPGEPLALESLWIPSWLCFASALLPSEGRNRRRESCSLCGHFSGTPKFNAQDLGCGC